MIKVPRRFIQVPWYTARMPNECYHLELSRSLTSREKISRELFIHVKIWSENCFLSIISGANWLTGAKLSKRNGHPMLFLLPAFFSPCGFSINDYIFPVIMFDQCLIVEIAKNVSCRYYTMPKFWNGWKLTSTEEKQWSEFKMMNRLEKYYESHPQQILRRTHNTMLMLPPPPLIQEGHGSITSSRTGTWSGYNIPGVTKQRVSRTPNFLLVFINAPAVPFVTTLLLLFPARFHQFWRNHNFRFFCPRKRRTNQTGEEQQAE